MEPMGFFMKKISGYCDVKVVSPETEGMLGR